MDTKYDIHIYLQNKKITGFRRKMLSSLFTKRKNDDIVIASENVIVVSASINDFQSFYAGVPLLALGLDTRPMFRQGQN